MVNIFALQVPYAEIGGQTLVLNVFDFDRFGKHDQIGQLQVPLGRVDLASTTELTTDIEAPPVSPFWFFPLHTVNCSYTGLMVGPKIESPVYKKSGISEYQAVYKT